MRTLLKPLPDEFLYSTLGRAAYRYGFWSPKRLLDILYGRRTVVAVADLPCNLAAVARATQDQWKLTVEELALRHTLVGYYTHFGGVRRRSKVLAAMAARGGSLQVRLGVCAGAARAPKRFRLCPRCHAADLARFGEGYWHRAHHLPGVLVCHLHGDILVESDVPFRPTGRHAYQAAPHEVDFSALPPLVVGLTRPDAALAIGVRSFEMLTADACPRPVVPDYRTRLAQCGWSAGRGQASRLRAAFRDFFGEELLRASFAREDGEALAWLCDVMRAPRRPMHPFKHILMTVFLDAQNAPVLDPTESLDGPPTKTWGVYRSAAMRQEAASLARFGLTTHAVASALEVDWKTAHKLLAPLPCTQPPKARDSHIDRQAWEQVSAAHPHLGKKALRGLAPAVYARLYRNDRPWLMAWQSRNAQRPSTGRRIDWQQRDLKVEGEVRQQVARTLQELPPRRASRSFVLGALGLRALLAHRAALLPRTCAALEELCETVENFQLRRLTTAVCQHGAHVPDRHLLRQAGIQPSRLADKGQSLVRRARDGAARMCKETRTWS